MLDLAQHAHLSGFRLCILFGTRHSVIRQRLTQYALSVHTLSASVAEGALQAQRLHLFGKVFDNLHSLQVLAIHCHLL